jgi:hypothetical protein
MDRVKRFDFTASAWSEGFSFVVPRPEEESRLFAFIGPFQPLVKLCQILRWFTLFNLKISGLDVHFHQPFLRHRHHDRFYVDLQLSFHKHYEWPENRIKYSARP